MSDQGLGDYARTTTATEQTSTASTVTQAPSYPARKPHRKSRTGCGTCKARKIKCDERHPACLNCISHGVECPFRNSDAISTASERSRHKPKSRSPSSCPPAPTPTPTPTYSSSGSAHDDLPLLELELLHNFSTLTYSTLAANPGVCDFWRVTVVQIGLRCDYIMRAVLAISALHLAYHRPDRRDFYTAQGILLHQRAARSAMRFIAPEGVESLDDAVNLFLFSMLTIYFSLASPRRSLADGSFFIGDIDIDSPGGTGFPDWTFLINGAKSLSNLLLPQGHTTLLAPFLAYGHGRWSAHRETPSPSPSPSSLSALRGHILSSVPASSDGLLATYTHALDELELALSARQDEAAPRDVLDAMLWLWEVSDSLMPLLKPNADSPTPTAPPQEAVAIFAHFSILLKHHESTWWLQGWAVHLISRAYEILDDEHRAWIEWPMREVRWMPGL